MNQEAALNLADSDSDDAAPEAQTLQPQTRRRSPKSDASSWPGNEPASGVRKVKLKKRPDPGKLPMTIEITDATLRDIARAAAKDIRARCVQEGSDVCWNVVKRYCAAYADFRTGDVVAFYLLRRLQDLITAYQSAVITKPAESREALSAVLLYRKTDDAFKEIQDELIEAINGTTENDDVPGVRQESRRFTRFIKLTGLPHERFVVKYKPGAQISVRTLDRETHYRKKMRGNWRKPGRYHKRRMNHHKQR